MNKLVIGLLTVISFQTLAQDSGFILTAKHEREEFSRLNPIKKNRKLNSLEKKQVKVLKCVRTILQNSKVSKERVDASEELISTLIMTNTESDLERLNKTCKESKSLLRRSRSIELEDQGKREMLESIQDERVSTIISNFIFVKNKCIVKRVYAQAAFLIGVKAGVGAVICRGTDGRKRKYIGPSIGIATNFGASAGVESVIMDMDRQMSITPDQPMQGATNYKPTKLDQKLGKIGSITFDKTSVYSVVAGRNYNTYDGWYRIRAIDSSDSSVGQNIGLSSLTGSSINLKLRFLNGRDNWEPMLKIISKQ